MTGITAEQHQGLQVRREGDLLWVTLSDPDRANALSPTMVSGLIEIYSADLRREGIRAVLLQAEGRHFSAGADLEHLRALRDAGAEENRQDSEKLRSLFESVLRQGALTVALVRGPVSPGVAVWRQPTISWLQRRMPASCTARCELALLPLWWRLIFP